MNPELPWIIFTSLSVTEVDELRAQVRELEGVQHRVAELEDRVDFAERMLVAGKAEAQRLGGGRT